ncbi:MAG: alcohol dehydrogenase catalytic domain-containing protein [Propionibacteriaceae bacterium]|nr:alcohol dehydrogenase catalytic domain-containing protein [Propionibacteriaceae bacterium]
MLSGVYTGDERLTVVDSEPETPGAGCVRVRVAYVGICGTDLHILHGAMDARVTMPAVIGHEMSGVVDAIGEGVTGWVVGDPVTVMPLQWDGTCPACRAGNNHVCQQLNFIGIDTPGALQEFWNVPAETLLALPAGVSLQAAALAEPTAVAVHDVYRSNLEAGDHVVVIGGGPIGVLIATVARSRGAEIVVFELDARRRELIEGLGFTALDPREVDQAAWVNSWTAEAGADVVFEVSGAAAAVLAATDLVRVDGTLVVVAIHPKPREVNLQRVFWRELRLVGARVYRREDFEVAIEMIANGAIPTEALITRVVPLMDLQTAFALTASGAAMKVLVEVQGARAGKR